MKQNGKFLFWIAVALLCIGVCACIGGIICEFMGQPLGFKICTITVAVTGPVALVLIIIKFMFFGGAPASPQIKVNVQSKPKEVKTVDVKPVAKTHEEELYEQYENLYKQNLISKEDLEKKRVELLGK